jgi:hypothetical protein
MNEPSGSVAQRAIRLLGEVGPRNDDELATVLDTNRIYINQVMRDLVRQGLIRRATGRDGKLVNHVVPRGETTTTTAPPKMPPRTRHERDGLLLEDTVKRAVADHLTAKGYQVTVMWGRDRGIDLDAVSPDDRIIVEAKGEGPPGPQQVNYFLNALGELIQRMSDESARLWAGPSRQQSVSQPGAEAAVAGSRAPPTSCFW